MRFATYISSGRQSYGLVVDGGIIDLGRAIGDRYPTLRAAIASGQLNEIARSHALERPTLSLSDIAFLPPIPEPGKLICFGGAFPSHLAEMKKEPPKFPGFHVRSSS